MHQSFNFQYEIFDRYPKKRPVLSPEMAELHVEILKANRQRETAISKISHLLESWMHRKVSKGALDTNKELLEIGAGTLNHAGYEASGCPYDAIEPMDLLYREKPELVRLRSIYSDIDEIPEDQRYDRIISIATLEHLTDLPKVVARAGMMLKGEGEFRVGIPCEGGFLWGLSWRVSTGLAFRLKTGLNFSDHMRYEHVNDEWEVLSVLNYLFDSVKVQRFPGVFHHLSLYTYIEAKFPNLEQCRKCIKTSTRDNEFKGTD